MTFDLIFTVALAVIALVLFAIDRLRLDQVSLAIPVFLLLGGVLTPEDAVSGLSSPATVTVAAMLVLGLGLRKTGTVAAIGRWARTAPLGGKRRRLLALCVIVAILSPFLNNTAVVMVFLPVFVALAEQAEEPASMYLMPLSFVAILGGTVTLIGTSTNLVVHGMAVQRGYDELTMFSIAPLGLISLGVGIVYLFTVGRAQLPRRDRPPDLSRKYDMRRFVTELEVSTESPATGRSLGELRWGERYAVSVLGIERGARDIAAPRAERSIQPGDVLYVQGSADRLLLLARQQRLVTPTDRTRRDLNLSTKGGRLVEVMVAPGSALLGRTLREQSFAQRYDATVLAIQQHGLTVHERLADVEFRVGDLLLVHGTAGALERLADEPGFVPMAEVQAADDKRPRAWVALGIMVLVVAVASIGLFNIMTAALAGVTLMVFTGCVRLDEIYAELDWMVVFVLAGLIPLGLALDFTGAASWLAAMVVDITGGWGPTGLIAAFYVLTALLTSVISNAAAAVMLTPVAILAALDGGVNPYALLVSVMFGASASFITPFGYQTNIMIYSPGGYRFSDFVKVGGVLNLLLLIAAAIFIPIFWPS
ncbi:MAG: anion permease [Gemmatimonadetes bacterium]|nr:anion permease [Gemmatimonadota bacterium]